jgi:hypothetical protein
MPMDFPDMDSLKLPAKAHKFREPTEGETEINYRTALADHVEPMDMLESMEIRSGKGWDKFNYNEENDLLVRSMGIPKDMLLHSYCIVYTA